MESQPTQRDKLRMPAMLVTAILLITALLPANPVNAGGSVHAGNSVNAVSSVNAGSIVVKKSEAKADFPHSINFLLNAESTTDIHQVTLIYGVTTESCFNSQARHEMEFDPAATVDLKWEWDLFRSGDLPPGIEIWWQWEIHAKDGSSLITEVQKQTIEDSSFQWKKLQRGSIILYWASGNSAFGQTLLDIAVRSADRLSESAGITTQNEIQLYIYPSAEDMKSILAHTTEWMGGVAFPEHRIILIGLPTTSLEWGKEVIPHELAHLQMEMRTFNCTNQDVPSWLNEGMAEFAIGPVPDAERTTIMTALEKGSLQSLASIAEGFPADTNRATLAYKQSRQVVTFLIETYGQEKMQALLDLLQSGENIQPALRSVYGLDTNGIDQTWRASLGFGTAPEPNFATATPVEKATAVPTLALMQIGGLATDTPTAAPSPTPTAAATAVVAATETAVPVEPTATQVPAVVDNTETNATGSLLPYLLAGGAIVVVLLLAALLVLPKINQRK